MADTGTVTNVTDRPVGSVLAAAAVATDTELEVVNLGRFDADGGELTIGEETHGHAPIGEADTVLDLLTPLAEGYDEDTPVLVYPPQTERIAYYIESGGAEELEARVPHSLWDRLPTGVRGEDPDDEDSEVLYAEEIEVEQVGDEWVVRDVIAREPHVDGSYIDPDTLPPAEVATDGVPPDSSPTPTVLGGPGFLAVRWNPITNNEPVTYAVHVSTEDDFTPDESTYHGEIRGSTYFIKEMPDGSALEYFEEAA